MTATWKAEFFCKQKCPAPTQQYSPVCLLYPTTSLTVMPNPLPLASHVVSGRVRESLVNCHFYLYSLACSYQLKISKFKKTKPKNHANIIWNTVIDSKQKVTKHETWDVSQLLIFMPVHSQAQHELCSF